MKVADRVHLPPWALDDAPSWWVDRVRLALMAESAANAERERRSNQRAQRTSSGARGRRLG